MLAEVAAAPSRGGILIVDDAPANLTLLTRMLRQQGYAVHAASEGGLALRFLRETVPDLILLDVVMPGLDGYQLCAQIKADPRTSGTPVIFISSADDVIDKVRAFASGGVDYIVKPFHPEEVLARIETHLALRALRLDLEARVRERTVELLELNERLQREMAEHARTAQEMTDLYNRAPCGYHSLDHQARFVRINDTELHWLGYTRQEVVGKLKIVDIITPECHERLRGYFATVKAGGEVRNVEVDLLRKDGTIMPVLVNAIAVTDSAGRFLMSNATLIDIAARRSLEQQLRHAQKLEAVGRLAGGIAHDFNNILTVIIGYSGLALDNLSPGDPLYEPIHDIRKAGERASALTTQLLAFSRRQILRPRVFDLNAVVADMDKMLRRLIGEDVELHAVLDPELGRVRADLGQIEQVIMNLAVNARDAMPAGGKLTIRTRNFELGATPASRPPSLAPGCYVVLAVSDTGQGIDEEVQAHIFEPFFTTKQVGTGTGLGLSTVYGIVEQSGGHIAVSTRKAGGTTFEIYLPRVDEALSAVEPVPALAAAHGQETILLVEDEAMVRTLSRQILETAGYTVLEASSAGEALSHCDSHAGAIDLLITDVVMPQMGGPELATRISDRRPSVPVLYVSGYTEDAIVHRGALECGTSFLQKPFRPDDLRRKVRQVLEAGRSRA